MMQLRHMLRLTLGFRLAMAANPLPPLSASASLTARAQASLVKLSLNSATHIHQFAVPDPGHGETRVDL